MGMAALLVGRRGLGRNGRMGRGGREGEGEGRGGSGSPCSAASKCSRSLSRVVIHVYMKT